jgi:uncharacterized membrane protein (DUF2068 family)
MRPHPIARTRTLHAIALLEAVKGIAVLIASVGLLGFLHHDARHLVHEIVRHFGMNPDARYPMILLHYADILENTSLRMLVLFALGYAAVRLVEAYGLWNDMAWGEWLGALSGGIYIPFEVRHLVEKPSIAGAVIFAINVLVVGFLAFRLYRKRHPVRVLPARNERVEIQKSEG